MFCAPIYWPKDDTNKDLDRQHERDSAFMNEFLLFALVIVNLVIRHGAPTTEGSTDRQDRENEQSSQPAGKQ